MTKTFCDRCNAEIVGRRHRLSHEVTSWDTRVFDVCSTCAELILAVLQPPSVGASSPSR